MGSPQQEVYESSPVGPHLEGQVCLLRHRVSPSTTSYNRGRSDVGFFGANSYCPTRYEMASQLVRARPPQGGGVIVFFDDDDPRHQTDLVLDGHFTQVRLDPAYRVNEIVELANRALPPTLRARSRPQLFPGGYVEVRLGYADRERLGSVLTVVRAGNGGEYQYEIWTIENDATFPRSGRPSFHVGAFLELPDGLRQDHWDRNVESVEEVAALEQAALNDANRHITAESSRWVFRAPYVGV